LNLLWDLLIICPLLFLAGFIDAIAGGGGIIALPTYIMTGMPLNMAYGCNKLQSCLGTFSALVRYWKSRYVDVKAALISSCTAVAASFVSTEIMLHLPDIYKSWIIVGAMCFIIVLTLFMRVIPSGDKIRADLSFQNVWMLLGIGLLLGLYDGFFGPGGGTVALMLFCIIFKYDIRTASGNGKVLIVVSNFIAAIKYMASGNILYTIAIPAAVANICGGYLGAALAVKKGRKLVSKFLVIAAVLLVVQAIVRLV